MFIYFYVTLKSDGLQYMSCSTLFVFGFGRPRTPIASKIEPIVTKVNSWKSLLFLEIAASYSCCLAALRPTLGQYLENSFTNMMLITAFFFIFVMTQRVPNGV